MTEKQVSALATTGSFRGKLLRGHIGQTHISWVILTTRFAFKIKKPLKLSFLDFSTLPKRKRYCEKELLLNRRFSDIYYAVVPVRFYKGKWWLGNGNGKIVDYAVQMKRMMATKKMDMLLKNQKVKKESILLLAEIVAGFHKKATIVSSGFNISFARRQFNDINRLTPTVSKILGKRYVSIISRAVAASDKFLRKHAFRIRERIAIGYTRDVHGDLHSGNIFLYRRPVIFDCIEFNDQYRQIDVINEVAFFCMDLEAFKQQRLAQIFLEHYNNLFPCFDTQEDQQLFRYYKCYRANVRAKVHAMAAAQQKGSDVDFRGHVDALKKYLLLIESYLRQIKS